VFPPNWPAYARLLSGRRSEICPTTYGWVILESVAGLVDPATLWLTFFPPAAYRAHILKTGEPR